MRYLYLGKGGWKDSQSAASSNKCSEKGKSGIYLQVLAGARALKFLERNSRETGAARRPSQCLVKPCSTGVWTELVVQRVFAVPSCLCSRHVSLQQARLARSHGVGGPRMKAKMSPHARAHFKLLFASYLLTSLGQRKSDGQA